jgi:hypothetical protein
MSEGNCSPYTGVGAWAPKMLPTTFSEAGFPGGPGAEDLLRYFGNKRE